MIEICNVCNTKTELADVNKVLYDDKCNICGNILRKGVLSQVPEPNRRSRIFRYLK